MPAPKPFTPTPRTLEEAQCFWVQVLLSFGRDTATSDYLPAILLNEGKYYVVALNMAEIEDFKRGDTISRCLISSFVKDDYTIGDEVPYIIFYKTRDLWWESDSD